ncbi:hypothetical protein GCM10027615_78930 [Plantactinospora veratri]
MSSEDIDKGQRWGSELSELLATTSQGLVCVTSDNVSEPWLNFEAGALAKSVTAARVRPVLLDVRPADVTGPLAQFQATSLTEKADVFKLMASLNASTDKPMDQPLLKKSFDRAWSEFDEAVNQLARMPEDGKVKAVRQSGDKIDEILSLVRDLERRLPAFTAQHMAEPGDILVDYSEVDQSLGTGRYPVREFDNVSDFLNEVYARMNGFVPAFSYGARWELFDVIQNVSMTDLGSAWSRRNGRSRDFRTLNEVGLRGGKILAVRLIRSDESES